MRHLGISPPSASLYFFSLLIVIVVVIVVVCFHVPLVVGNNEKTVGAIEMNCVVCGKRSKLKFCSRKCVVKEVFGKK